MKKFPFHLRTICVSFCMGFALRQRAIACGLRQVSVGYTYCCIHPSNYALPNYDTQSVRMQSTYSSGYRQQFSTTILTSVLFFTLTVDSSSKFSSSRGHTRCAFVFKISWPIKVPFSSVCSPSIHRPFTVHFASVLHPFSMHFASVYCSAKTERKRS